MYLEEFPFKNLSYLKGIFIKVSNSVSFTLFSLTAINISTVIILFSMHLPSIDTCKSSSEPLWYLGSYLILRSYFTSKLTF